jgi:hypothetical protein
MRVKEYRDAGSVIHRADFVENLLWVDATAVGNLIKETALRGANDVLEILVQGVHLR